MQKQQHHQEIPVNVSRFNIAQMLCPNHKLILLAFDLRDCRVLGALKLVNLSSVGRRAVGPRLDLCIVLGISLRNLIRFATFLRPRLVL